MKRWFLVMFLTFTTSSMAMAEAPPVLPAESESPLRHEALKEIANNTAKPADRASDAQVSGVLTLEDPGLHPLQSPWRWHLGVRLQKFQPQGHATLPDGSDYRLDRVNSSPCPFLETGVRRGVFENDNVRLALGVRLEAGYTTQRTDVTFPNTGKKVDQVRLSSSLADAGVLLALSARRLPSLEAELGWSEGLVNYTQSSPVDMTNFSKQGRFAGWNTGLWWHSSENVSFGADLAQRSLKTGVDLDLQESNFSVGTRMMW